MGDVFPTTQMWVTRSHSGAGLRVRLIGIETSLMWEIRHLVMMPPGEVSNLEEASGMSHNMLGGTIPPGWSGDTLGFPGKSWMK